MKLLQLLLTEGKVALKILQSQSFAWVLLDIG